jgi:hypothetical protein
MGPSIAKKSHGDARLEGEETVTRFDTDPEFPGVPRPDRPLSVSRSGIEEDFDFDLAFLALDEAQDLMLRKQVPPFLFLRRNRHEIDQQQGTRLRSEPGLEDISLIHISPLRLKGSGRSDAPVTRLRV